MALFYRYSPTLFFLLLFRSSLEPALNLTKVGGIGFGAVLNFVVIAMFVLLCISNRFKLPAVVMRMWTFFLVIGLISIYFSPEKVNSFRSLISIFTYFAVFAIPFHFIRSKEAYVACVKLVLFSAVIPFVYVFKEFIFPEMSTTKDGFRLFSTFSHPNIFAFYCVLIGSICLYILKSSLFNEDRRLRKIATIMLFLSLVGLLGTKTRSAWIAMIAVVAVYAYFREKKYLIYLAVLGGLAMLIPSIQQRVFDIFQGNDVNQVLDEGGALNSYAWRKVVWMSSWEYIKASPFLGHGYDTFSYYFLGFFTLQETKSFDAHNAYVQIAFDMGFLGLFGYLILLGQSLAKCWKVMDRDRANSIVFGLLISYCLVNYSDNMLFYLSFDWYFWFFLGAFFAFNDLKMQENNKTFEKNI